MVAQCRFFAGCQGEIARELHARDAMLEGGLNSLRTRALPFAFDNDGLVSE
jgi:hypothetical protein